MKTQVKFLPVFLPILLFFIFPCMSHGKSIIEPCSSSGSCTSLLLYHVPFDSKLSEIAYRFQVNISDILAANSINPTIPSAGHQIVHAKSLVKVPILCSCVDGIRRSVSTTYIVRPADTVDSISFGYGGLVSAQQIVGANGINTKNPLNSGASIEIPLPCTCFNNSNSGVATVFMSYVVQTGESLTSIGREFGATVTELQAVNGLAQGTIESGDILAIPIPACSSTNLNWYNESLIVPNGSFALTANNCIKCICGPSNLNLQCLASGITFSCSHLQCKGSNLFIGDIYATPTSYPRCNVTSCVYRGHHGRKIFRSLVNSSHVQCPGNNHSATSPMASPLPKLTVPFLSLSPTPAPAPVPASVASSTQTSVTDSSSSTSTYQNPNISNKGEILNHDSYCHLWLIFFSFCLLLY